MAKKFIVVDGFKYKLNWKPSRPDIRDIKYKPKLKATPLPPIIDLSANLGPVLDQGSLGSCSDEITEVLTDSGWKLFKDLYKDDKLASVDPKTGHLIFELPTRIIELDHDGDMYYGKNKYNLDFAFTPDHKMLIRKWNENKKTLNEEYEFVEMKNIGWHVGLMTNVNYQGTNDDKTFSENLNLPKSTWLKFLGIFVAKGKLCCHALQKVKVGENIEQNKNHTIQLVACKEREKIFIYEVLDELKIKYSKNIKDRIKFNDKRIFNELKRMGYLGTKTPFKFVPDFVFDLSADHIKDFLLGYFMENNCEQNGQKNYYTSSKQLADDLQRLIFLSGNNSYISETKNSTTKVTRKKYKVSEVKKELVSITKKDHVTIKHYKGKVYCAEVPTYHTLITRRNGIVIISSNCTANGIAGAIAFNENLNQKPYIAPSRLFIYYNERSMEGTTNSDSGADIRDGIKSLSTYGWCSEDTWGYDISRFRNKPPQTAYDEAAQRKITQYLAVDQNLSTIQNCLADGFPIVFGFTVYSSFEGNSVRQTGIVNLPNGNERSVGGHCFTKDTSVSLLNGKELTFEELVRNYSNKEFWVYSCDKNGNIVPGKAHHPRKTKENAKIIKITLDNNQEIKCTEDHLFLMRDGSYKEAKLLSKNDNLMSLYKNTKGMIDSNIKNTIKIEFYGYEDVYDITVDEHHNFALTAGVFVHNCVLCYGYSDEEKRFKVRNSWGQNWGMGGNFTMPYEYLTNENLSDDFWSVRSY